MLSFIEKSRYLRSHKQIFTRATLAGQRPDRSGAPRVHASNPPPEGLQDGVHPHGVGASLPLGECAHSPVGSELLCNSRETTPRSRRCPVGGTRPVQFGLPGLRAGVSWPQETPDQVRGVL